MSLAAADKLLKLFEALKNYRDGIPVADSNPLAKKKEGLLPKKDRLSHISAIPELVCSSAIRSLQEFPKLLSIGVDTLLASCDDDESDVRLVAGEALNKLLKELLDSNLGRLLVELYKEIKKNDAARSLKAALLRFSDIAHLIRPQKCRPFVANLLPCLGRICLRTEESLQEALATAIQKIFPVLGSFTSDTEVKQLMKAFLPNLKSVQATTRRTASSSLAIICQNSRKPSIFHEWLINILLGMVLPLQDAKPSPVYLGVLNCIRQIIPHLDDSFLSEEVMRGSFGSRKSFSGDSSGDRKGVSLRQLLQIYEIIMQCTKHTDHNVVNASLETLSQLLRTPPTPLLQVLLSHDGIVPTIKPDTSPADDIELTSDKDSAIGDLETGSTGSSAQTDADLESESNTDIASTSDFESGKSHEDSISVGTTGTDLSSVESTDDLSSQMRELRVSEDSSSPDLLATSVEDMSESDEGESTFSDNALNVSNVKIGRSLSDPGMIVVEDDVDPISGESEVDASHLETEIPDDLPIEEQDRICDDLGELNQASEPIRTESITTQDVRMLVESSFEIDAVACTGVPMVHIVRVMCSFLLSGRSGEVLPDSNVRVSVKSLALLCIANAMRHYPEGFLVGVLPDSDSGGLDQRNAQLVRDILLFNAHPDPQLRGGLASVLSFLIAGGLRKGSLDFNTWSEKHCLEYNTAALSIESLLSLLSCILQDDSPVAIRQACSALKACFAALCGSVHCHLIRDLIDVLVQLRKNSYWLVKVELLELIEVIDLRLITYLEAKKLLKPNVKIESRLNYLSIQDLLLKEVVFSSLKDDDGRVRHAAAMCCVNLVPKLILTRGNPGQQSVLQIVSHSVDDLSIKQINNRGNHQPSLQAQATILHNLSKIVSMTTEILNHSTSKYLTVGCIHLLHSLAQAYPIASYPAAWGCTVSSHCSSPVSPHFSSTNSPPRPGSPSMCCTGGGGPLSLAVGNVTSSWIAYDLNAHQNLLQLAGQLLFGIASSGISFCLKSQVSQQTEESASSSEAWNVFSDTAVAPLAEKIIVHLIRLLNVFAHILDGITPGAHSFKLSFPGQNKDKSTQSSIPGGASHASPQSTTSSTTAPPQPMSSVPKRLLKSKRALSEADLPNTDKTPTRAGGGGEGSDGEQKHPQSPPPKGNIGTFHNLPHYMKLYEVIKGTYQNYQVTLSKVLQDKFTSFLRCTLNVLSHFLEISSFPDIGKHVEEILGYLQVCVKAEPCKTFLCVQQLLRAMFGINAVSQPDLIQATVYPGCLGDTLITLPVSMTTDYFDESGGGLYYDCFELPQRVYRQSIEKIPHRDEELDSSFKRGIGSLFKKIRKKTGSIIRPAVKIDKQSPIHSFIRLFEPLVIRALKEFTISTSVTLQQQVLSLLAQLIKLRVNYALLDADQVFITYVQKQFEYVDAGQIKNCDTFLPFVFQFLVLLSYDCFQPKFNQAKAIVGMPKVIQLCDGIMASGQSAKTHAIPALQPIVHDLFVLRTSGKADAAKEVETQREVVVSMLLRLVQYAEVLEMLTMVLNCYQREDEDRWKKMSRQVIDMLLPVLAKQQVFVENEFGFTALQGIFLAVSPVSLRPADVLLKVLFVPVQLSQLLTLERWLSMVLVLLHTIQGHVSEGQLISRMNEINIKANILNDMVDETLDEQYRNPLEQTSAETSEKLFSLFLLTIANISVQRIVSLANKLSIDVGHEKLFLHKQFCRLTLTISHMFKSENYSRVTSSASALCNSQPPHPLVAGINSSLDKIIPTHPLIVLHWSNVLKSLRFSDTSYWYNLIETGLKTGSPKQETNEIRDCIQPINIEATRQSAVLLYCDLLIEKEEDRPGSTFTEVTVLLQSCMEDLIHLHDEIPVIKLFSQLYKSSEGSRTLLETFISSHALRTQNKASEITYTKHLIQCLASVHSSHTCLLLKVLAEFFLDSQYRSITRFVESNICKRLEIEISRLKDPKKETSTEELTAVCHLMASKKRIQRNPRLCSLVHHILASSPRTQNTEMTSTADLVFSMKNYTVDQEWFSHLASHSCCTSGPQSSTLRAINPQESILLLSALNFRTVCGIMNREEFNVGLLEDCILIGVERTLQFTSRRMSLEETVIKPYDNTEHFESTGVDHLLLAAKLTMFRHMYHVVQEVMTNIPCEAQDESNASSRIVIDQDKFAVLCKDSQWCSRILDLARGIVSYCSVVGSLPRQCVLSMDEICCLCRFIFLPLAIVHHKLVSGIPPNTVELKIALNCIGKLLFLEYGQSVNDVEYVVLVCQAINQVYTLIRAVSVNGTERLVHVITEGDTHPRGDREDEFQSITVACDQISDLVSYTYTYLRPGSHPCSVLPQFLYEPFTLAFVGLGRRPMVNSYARTPPLVWKLGWMPTPEGPLKTELPPLPIEILKEKDVLNEFVMRVNILGWISRQQFEETWAALLGVLSSPPLPEEVTPEEDMEATHSCCLAVRCISALLLQTTLYPSPGNCTKGGFLHSPRHRDLPFLGSRAGKKLSVVRGFVEDEFVNTCCTGAGKSYLTRDDVKHTQSASFQRSNSFISNHGNTAVWTSNKLLFDNPLYGLNVDRILGFHDYTLGQISLLGLHSQAQAQLQEYPDSDDDGAIVVSIPRMAKPEKLDIRSCLQFLLELFEQWMSPYVQPRTPLMLLSEATKALVVFSDLFVDGHHFEWVLDTLLDLHQNHPSEDDLLTQYSLPVICKALAFLKIEGQTAERVFKILETSLRSPHVPLQMSALYGSLYILESHVPTVVALLIPILTEHLGRKLNALPNAVMLAQQHLLVMWSTLFYLLEHYSDEIPDAEFKPNILKAAVRLASSNEESTPPAVYHAIMRGLERLVVSFALSSAESDSLVKLSVDRLSMQNPQRSISALGLLITCMYTGKIGDRPSGIYPQPDTTEFPTEDRLLIAMERVTVLFERIRKGLPSEAQIVARVLPRLLLDFFPAQEIMNKVIGEFLSSQQPYPELMAEVLFKVFEGLHSQGQHVEVRDWVVLSLASFVQRTPLSMAIWSLTCFFVSASTSKWIRALFPHILGRINKLEEIDKKYFCAAALDFYSNQNLDASQKQTFLSTFKSVALTEPTYNQLITSCEKKQPCMSEMIKIQS